MDIGTFVFLGLVLATAVYAVVIYNGLVSLKHNVSKAWSNIDVLLKQRHDELPKLVTVCKEYMKYEPETLKKIIAARSAIHTAQQAGDIKSLGQAEAQMRSGLGRLFALAESYPDLKANDSFQHLQQRISGLENSISDRREFYNESVNANNVRIEQFPDVILARLFSFREFDLLEFTEEERQDLDIQALFSH